MNYHPTDRLSTEIVAIFDEALAKTTKEMKERLNDVYVSRELNDFYKANNRMEDTRLENIGNIKRFGEPIEQDGSRLRKS